MAKIDTSRWKEFIIGGLFEISRPVARSQKKYEDGVVPFVASGNFNNGVTKWCTPQGDEVLDAGNCITVSPLDGSAFYQAEPFLGRGGAGSAILMLRNTNLTELSGLFVSSVIRRSLTKYTYSDQLNSETIEEEMILLPVDASDEPDWAYMDEYMSAVLSKAEESLAHLRQADSDKHTLDISGWKKFHLYDETLFDIDMGTKLDRVKMLQSNPDVNFVGRANANNGITARVDSIAGIEPYSAGNMTLSLGGEYLGSCFVQPDKFYTSQNVIVLKPKHEMSFPVKQFIATMVFRESRSYYKAFIDELNRHIKTDFSFYLPVDSMGEPDWVYMEKYMQTTMDNTESDLSAMRSIS